MSGAHNQQSTPTWTEPPWSGWIETTGDALLILEAARRGLIPRVTRRLVDSERKMITSGSVFVFDEDESGIKRWTDGFFWSPSRILGNFLLYRETDKRGAGHRSARNDPDPNDGPDGTREVGSLSRPKSDSTVVDKHRERTLMGSLTNTYKFKPDGLMKKVGFLPRACVYTTSDYLDRPFLSQSAASLSISYLTTRSKTSRTAVCARPRPCLNLRRLISARNILTRRTSETRQRSKLASTAFYVTAEKQTTSILLPHTSQH